MNNCLDNVQNYHQGHVGNIVKYQQMPASFVSVACLGSKVPGSALNLCTSAKCPLMISSNPCN